MLNGFYTWFRRVEGSDDASDGMTCPSVADEAGMPDHGAADAVTIEDPPSSRGSGTADHGAEVSDDGEELDDEGASDVEPDDEDAPYGGTAGASGAPPMSQRIPIVKWFSRVVGMTEAALRTLPTDEVAMLFERRSGGYVSLVNRTVNECYNSGRSMCMPISAFMPPGPPARRSATLVVRVAADTSVETRMAMDFAELQNTAVQPIAMFQIDTGFDGLPRSASGPDALTTAALSASACLATAPATVARAYAYPDRPTMLDDPAVALHFPVVGGEVRFTGNEPELPAEGSSGWDSLLGAVRALWQEGCQVVFTGRRGQGGCLGVASAGQHADQVYGAVLRPAEASSQVGRARQGFLYTAAYTAAYCAANRAAKVQLYLTLIGDDPALAVRAVLGMHPRLTNCKGSTLDRVVVVVPPDLSLPTECDSWLCTFATTQHVKVVKD
ncbi:MAG: hypothetical protein M0R22_10805, partial [Dehalococcoidia bacterium]|nr:hypothetical protein [Dehalococcoidia bacterium]